VDHEDEAVPNEQAGAASAHVPGDAAPAGPPDPIAQTPAYPPPTGPEHGREFRSDEDGDGPTGTEAEGVAYAETLAAAKRAADEPLRVALAACPDAAAPAGPPDPVPQAPAYPPPTGPEHGREYSSDEDGDGPYGTEAGDVNWVDTTGVTADRVVVERLHIAATTHPRGSLDGALPSPPVGLEDLPTD